MKPKSATRLVATCVLLSLGSSHAAPLNGQFSWANLGTGNSDTLVGLSTSKTYLENVNLFGGALTINGVPFTGSGALNPSGTGLGGTTWAIAGMANTFASGGTNPGGQLGALTNDFIYSAGSNTGTLTLGGLTVGQHYILTFYSRAWDPAGGRTQWLTASDGPAGVYYDQDYTAAGQGALELLRYTFQATGTNQTISIKPEVGGTAMHLYGFGTEQLNFDKSWVSGGDWTTATWSSAGAPNSQGANANFTTQGSPTAINLDASQTVGHVQFNGANAWTLSSATSSTLTLQADAGGSSVLSAPVGTHTISTAMTWSSDVLKTGAGTIVLSGPLADNGKKITITEGALDIANSGAQSLAGIISGSGNLHKSGAGTLTVTGRNNYAGQTTVNGGILKLQSGSLQTRPLLLSDNFTATGTPNTADLNYNLANRQTGSLATSAWTPGGNVQVGNSTFVGQPPATGGDYLLLAGRTASLTGLPLSTANSPGPLMISFDMFKGTFGNTGDWTSFSIRSTTDGHPVAGSGEFGMLYRNNTGIQIFNNGAAIANFTSTAGGGAFAFYLTDTAGTGSPFAGSGTKVTVTQGGNVLGTYTLNTGMGTSYISFGAAGGVGGVDNLFVGSPPALPVTTPVAIAATSSLDLNGFTQRVASLADSGGSGGSVINSNSSTPAVLDLNPASGSTSYTGVIGGGIGTIGLAKSGAGTQILAGTNTYTGVTAINGGTLQLGDGTSGHDGSIAGTSIVNNSVLSYNLFGASSYAGVISGSGSLTKVGNGTLTLGNANSYAGATTINGGTLALGAGGSLNSASNVHIGAGGTFDVSAIASYPWPVGASLAASGSTAAAATLKGGTTVSLGSQPAALNITPTAFSGDVAHPALHVSAGVLDLGTSTITVNNTAATPLGVGNYTLITGGTVTGTPALNPVIGGTGLLPNTNTSLVVTGGNLILQVTSSFATTSTSISLQSPWTSTSTYGEALAFNVTVTGNSPGGTVTVKNGGVSGITLGSASLSGGAATVTLSPLNLLQAGTYNNIVAVYDGDANNLASISAALSPQNVGLKTITVSSPSAATKYYDATTVANLGGTLIGVVAGDTLDLGAGTFANAGPGNGIGVTFSITGAPVANYTLTQPGSTTANIVASAIWTGNTLDTMWNTPGNWLANLVPGGANITANFTGLDIPYDEVVELESARVIGNLSFSDTDPVNSPANWILGNNLTAANTLTLAGTSPTVTVNALGDDMAAIINAAVAGTNGLTKAGSGTLTLAENNTYSGGTIINAGTLQVGNGINTGSLGSGNLVNNANFALNYGYGALFNLPINTIGAGTTHVISGDLRMYAQGSTGTITVDDGGNVTIWAPGAVSLSNDFVLNSFGGGTTRGAINHDGGNGLVTLNGSITLTGDSRIGVGGTSSNNMTVNGKVTGAGMLYVFDRATVNTETRLTNNTNDYSGGTTIEQGRLSITQANALGTGPVTITGANSQLLIDELTATIPNDFTLGGGGNPTSHVYGNGTMVFHNDGTTATLSGTVTLESDAKIRHYSFGGTTIFSNPIGGTGNLTFEGGGGAANHNQIFTLQGGPSTYDNTTIRASDGNPIVRLDGGLLPADGALTINDFAGFGTRDAVFDLNGYSQTVAGLNGTVSSLGVFVTNSGATPSTLTVNTATLDSFAGVIGLNTTTATTGQAAGGADITLVKNGTGTLTLSGANTYTGPTAVNEGALLVGGYGTVGSVTIPNAGFETPAVAGFLYNPTGASWTFNARSGICSNTFNPTAAPQGARCAFIQSEPADSTVGEISQTISLASAGSYTITFKGEGRDGIYGPCGVIVKVDGIAVGTWGASAFSQTQWQSYQTSVNLAAGSHTLSFVANNTLGGDRSVAIDDVQMTRTGAFGSLGNNSVTVASAATFGGTGSTGGAVTWSTGAKASFTVTMAYGADNYTPMNIAGVMTFNGTEVHLNLPPNLTNGTYTLAASSATPVANGAFPTPILDSGSYVAGSAGVITMDLANKKLVLTVSSGSLYQTWAGVGGPAFGDLNSEGIANGMAWLLGATSPTAGGTVGLLPAAAENGSGLTLHFLRVHETGTAKLYLQYSNGLGTWNEPGVLIPAELSGTGTIGGDIGYVAIPGSPTGATDDITLTIPDTHASGGKLFGRLKALED
ncbi:MAG: autotransporter-associated beta strand repeat-containing protein [Verrucomicrobiota bacterium]